MVKFICYHESKKLFITGNIPQLGQWKVDLPMKWSGDYFEITVEIEPYAIVEFTYKTGPEMWEFCENHIAEINTANISISSVWNDVSVSIEVLPLSGNRDLEIIPLFSTLCFHREFEGFNSDDSDEDDSDDHPTQRRKNRDPFVVSGYMKNGKKTKSYIKNNKVEVGGYTRADGIEVNGYVRRKTPQLHEAEGEDAVSGYTKKNGTKVKGYLRKNNRKN